MIRVVSLVLILINAATCAKILGAFTTPSYSHQIVFQPIWKELSLRGHQVTVLTPSPLNDPSLTNLTEIDLSSSYDVWKESLGDLGTSQLNTFQEMKVFMEAYDRVSDVQLSDPRVKALIHSDEKFDLLLVEYLHPAMYGFKDIFNCPMIGINSIGLTPIAYDHLGMPNHPVVNPHYSLPFSADLSFMERVISVTHDSLFIFAAKSGLFKKMNNVLLKHFPNARSATQIAREISLLIVNSNLAIRKPKPTVPMYVEISGIHLQPKKPLPHDLKEYLDNSTEGVIYFSLGTNVNGHLFSKEKLDILMQTFSEIPYKVLWKTADENMPNKPENVKLSSWLPQQDVLGHPNVKLFISQGGIQSLDEAIHNKVPVLLMPFFADQKYNTHHLITQGAALSVSFLDLTVEDFKMKINETINNPAYKEKISELHSIAYDHPMPPLEKAVWWIEYVIRHKGAKHLAYEGRDLPFYKHYLLDVLAFFALCFSSIGYILYVMFRQILRIRVRKSHTE